MFTVCVLLLYGLRDDLELMLVSASLLDEAKRWFESSTIICKYVPNGQQRAEKVCAMV